MRLPTRPPFASSCATWLFPQVNHKLTHSFHGNRSYASMTYSPIFLGHRSQTRGPKVGTENVLPNSFVLSALAAGCGKVEIYMCIGICYLALSTHTDNAAETEISTSHWILLLGKFSYTACAPLFYTCGLPSVLCIFPFAIPVFFDTDISHELCVIRTRALLCIQKQKHPSCHKPLRPTPPI